MVPVNNGGNFLVLKRCFHPLYHWLQGWHGGCQLIINMRQKIWISLGWLMTFNSKERVYRKKDLLLYIWGKRLRQCRDKNLWYHRDLLIVQ